MHRLAPVLVVVVGFGCGDSTPLHPDAHVDALPDAPSVVCGDHTVQAPEECDDGNATVNDGCTGCTIDRNARKGQDASDHAPVVAELT